MPELSGRVDELLRAPVAAALFVLAEREALDPDRLAEPAVVTALASRAMWELGPWMGDAAASRARFVASAAPLREVVEAVAADLRNAWWTAPLDRAGQLYLAGDEDRRGDPMTLSAPAGPLDGWESYAQKPAHHVVTSTELPGPPIRSGAHAELTHGASDWNPTYPIRQTRLRVAADARLYEINSADDWHTLALNYGDPATHPGSDYHLRESAGIENGLAPTWSAVAADYDGVHLTFAGLLTALYVPVRTDDVITTLWAWEWECTRWLRAVFTAATTLPDLVESPPEAVG